MGLLAKLDRGIVLVVFAGMEYAAAVEAKKFDVITGGTAEAEEMLRDLLRGIDRLK